MARLILGPAEAVIEEIRRGATSHRGGRGRIVVAWARDDGVCWLLQALDRQIQNLEVIVGLNEGGTTVEALLRLLPEVRSLMVFFKHPRQIFHPKIYWFDDGTDNPRRVTLIVGSSNLTHGGLLTNYEASMVAELDPRRKPEDRHLLREIVAAWQQLVTAPYAHTVSTTGAVERLYQDGYLVLERTLRRRQRLSARVERSTQGVFPTAPPPQFPAPPFEPINIPFPLRQEVPEEPEPLPEDVDPAGVPPLADRFFVRTLTANDIEKLHGRRPGTFEPDLGETARNRFPAFWGWPAMYEEVVRQLPRREWKVKARLVSSLTEPDGVEMMVTLWYREARPGHPAEHRLGLGPIGVVRMAIHPAFDANGVIVVQRAATTADHQFVVRLLTAQDPGYQDFRTYLMEDRPQHRFGYGP